MHRMEWIGWACTVLAIGFIVYVNMAEKKVDTTEEPISQPVDEWNNKVDSALHDRLDAVMDSMRMDCGK